MGDGRAQQERRQHRDRRAEGETAEPGQVRLKLLKTMNLAMTRPRGHGERELVAEMVRAGHAWFSSLPSARPVTQPGEKLVNRQGPSDGVRTIPLQMRIKEIKQPPLSLTKCFYVSAYLSVEEQTVSYWAQTFISEDFVWR